MLLKKNKEKEKKEKKNYRPRDKRMLQNETVINT